MDSFKQYMKFTEKDKLNKNNFKPTLIVKAVERAFPGIYITLKKDDFKWNKKKLAEELKAFYYSSKLHLVVKQSCSDEDDKKLSYFSSAEHGIDDTITVCFQSSLKVGALMKEWKSMKESDWKDIKKNKFMKELCIMLFHEYAHLLQERWGSGSGKKYHVEGLPAVKDSHGEYLSSTMEIQAFAIETSFCKRTFGHHSPAIHEYRKYPVLWKFFKYELEKWK